MSQPRAPRPRRRLGVVLAVVTVLVAAGCGGSKAPAKASSVPVATPGATGQAITGPSTTGPSTTGPSTTGQATTTTGAKTTTTTGAGRLAQAANAGWLTYDGAPDRSGVDPTSPPVGHVVPAWTSPLVDGEIYAQPLVVGATVIVATEDNSVYALEASTGRARWMRHLGPPVPGSTLPCGNIEPSGITGTPVADPSAGTLWVVSFSPPYHHTLWSLSLATGAVISSRSADPPGADPRAEQQRGALTLDGPMVYIPYGGLFGDCSDYHGWMVGLSITHPADSTPVTWETQDAEAGIWAPPGPVVAPDGTLLVATGNGRPVSSVGGSDSVIRLTPGLTLKDSFTPSDYAQLAAHDRDLGSTSPALVDGLVFEVGKDGIGYLLSATHFGGIGGQAASASVCGGGFGGTAVSDSTVFVSCFDGLYAIRVSGGEGGRPPALSVVWSVKGAHPGPPIVAGGDVWTVWSHGQLTAIAAATGSVEYRHSLEVAGSFPSPAAASGMVFAPDKDRVEAFAGA